MGSKTFNRKLIRTKGYSFLVTLPKMWIALNDLENAYAVDCEITKGGLLIIRPEKRDRNQGGKK
jgi:antitoxin component of MazEF toxin-antitoxin module